MTKLTNATNLFFALFITFLLGACTSQPSHLIISPELTNISQSDYQNKTATLTVVDLRVGNQIIQVKQKGEEALTLLSATQRIEQTIKNTLSKHLQQQGLIISVPANNTITVNIKRAVIEVNESMIKHSAKNTFVFQIKVNNGEKTLTTEYKSTNIEEAPLRADISALTLDFNQRLANALEWIINNEEIQNFIK